MNRYCYITLKMSHKTSISTKIRQKSPSHVSLPGTGTGALLCFCHLTEGGYCHFIITWISSSCLLSERKLLFSHYWLVCVKRFRFTVRLQEVWHTRRCHQRGTVWRIRCDGSRDLPSPACTPLSFPFPLFMHFGEFNCTSLSRFSPSLGRIVPVSPWGVLLNLYCVSIYAQTKYVIALGYKNMDSILSSTLGFWNFCMQQHSRFESCSKSLCVTQSARSFLHWTVVRLFPTFPLLRQRNASPLTCPPVHLPVSGDRRSHPGSRGQGSGRLWRSWSLPDTLLHDCPISHQQERACVPTSSTAVTHLVTLFSGFNLVFSLITSEVQPLFFCFVLQLSTLLNAHPD